MKRALVIGNCGFVGRHLVPRLRDEGYDVMGTEKFESLVLDYRMLRPFDVIVHLGANIVNVNERMKMGMKAFNDIILDKMVCDFVEEHPPTEAFIVMSSCAVDFPADPYCIVKRTLESFALSLQRSGVPVKMLRPFSGYGSDQSTEYPYRAIWERALRHEDPLVVWGGDQVRDWLWIDDLCDAIMTAIHHFPFGPTEVGTGIGHSLFELAVLIAEAAAYYPKIQCDYSKSTSSPRRVAHIDMAASYGWRAKVSLSEGIKRTAQYFRGSKSHV